MKAMDAEKKLCPFIQRQEEDEFQTTGPLKHIHCRTIDCMAWRWKDENSISGVDDGDCLIFERRGA